MSSNVLRNAWAVTKVFLARLRFLAVFLVAALVVGYWDTIQNYVDKWTRPPVAPDMLTQVSDIEYYCVMHPNVIRSEPGDCPICGMPLAKRKKGEKVELPGGVLARVQLTPRRIALAGVQTATIAPRDLIREIRAAATLDYDETRVAQLSARVAGRADELYVKSLGQQVKAGDPLYSIYSPEVYTAQREYLSARKRVRDLATDVNDDLRHDMIQVYNASMQKLVLWGATSADLDRLDQQFDQTGAVPTHFVVTSPMAGIVVKKGIFEGSYVQTGEIPYTIADLSNLWLQVRIYEPDVPLVSLGEPVAISVAGRSAEALVGKITFLAFQLDPVTRTLAARVEVPNPGLSLRPGLFADATIRVPVLPGRAARTPATTAPAAVPNAAAIFQAALEPYLVAQGALSQDKTQGVVEALHQMVAQLEPLKDNADYAPGYQRLVELVHVTLGGAADVEKLRNLFRKISAEMIALGKSTGVPDTAPPARVFRCPMGEKPNWIQYATTTVNPYQGQKMLTCGAQIDTLPRIAAPVATRPESAGTRILAVPRSAVILAGSHNVVFVANAELEGVFDMRGVKLGPLAGTANAGDGADADYYPVLEGLQAGDHVVTAGAFLLDAENRLNGGGSTAAPATPAATQPAG